MGFTGVISPSGVRWASSCNWCPLRGTICLGDLIRCVFLIWVFPKKKWYPQIIHSNRVFHYKPSILGYPYFWKHPYGTGRLEYWGSKEIRPKNPGLFWTFQKFEVKVFFPGKTGKKWQASCWLTSSWYLKHPLWNDCFVISNHFPSTGLESSRWNNHHKMVAKDTRFVSWSFYRPF